MKNRLTLIVILISLSFIFVGLYLSTKVAQNKLNYASNKQITLIIITPTPTVFAAFNDTSSAVSSSSGNAKSKVKKVIDGDTILLSDNRKVRYIGIDTPEIANGKIPAQCFADAAANFNKQLVENQNIELEKDVSETDKYGRLLRYVYADGVLINELLLTQGYARLEEIAPDTKYYLRFKQAETQAKEAKRGLWGKC